MVQRHIMAAATGHRDLLLPPEWHIGAEFRLTAGVHRRPDGTLRANTRGFVHGMYSGPPDGTQHRPIPRIQVWFDVTAVHRITGIYFDAKWTAVQFCSAPDRRPWEKVWTNVRREQEWWAESGNPVDRFN